MNPLSGSTMTGRLAESIRKTAEEIQNVKVSFFLGIAKKVKQISAGQYKRSSQDVQRLEDVKVYDCKNAENIAWNISAITNGILPKKLSPEQELLKSEVEQLKQRIHFAAESSLNKKLSFFEIVNVAAVLDHINYTTEGPIYNKMMDQLKTTICTDSLDDGVWAIFALRKVKNLKNYQFFENLLNEVSRHLRSLNPLQLSLFVKGLTQAEFKDSPLFDNIRNIAVKSAKQFTVNEAVNTLWALYYPDRRGDSSIVRDKNIRLIEEFTPKLIQQMGELNVDQTVRIAWVFKNMNIVNPPFFEAVRQRIQNGKKCLSALGLGNITRQFCNIQPLDDSLLIELIKEIEKRLERDSSYFTKETVVEISYAVLIKYCCEDQNFSIYEEFMEKMIRWIETINPSEWDYIYLCQIQVILIIYGKKSKETCPSLLSHIEEQAKAKKPKEGETNSFRKQVANIPNSSQFHLDVLHHLQLFLPKEIEIDSEYSIDPNFSIDIALKLKEENVAIEVDGHCHYDEKGKPLPKDIIKETLLKLFGWTVVRITHYDWPKNWRSGNSKQNKSNILKEKLGFLVLNKTNDSTP